MKTFIYSLVFVLAGIAHAEQQPVPQPPAQQEVVEFSTFFSVFVCDKVQGQQEDYDCKAGMVSAEKASVTLEKSADHQGIAAGRLSLASETDGYKHAADIMVKRHTNQYGTHYGFHVSETFFKADAQQPEVFNRTYGSIHVDAPANLNEVAFYGQIVKTDSKLYIPVLIIAPAAAEPQHRMMKMNPSMF